MASLDLPNSSPPFNPPPPPYSIPHSTTPIIILPTIEDPTSSYKSVLRPKPPSPPKLSPNDLRRLRQIYLNQIRVPAKLLEEGSLPWDLSIIGKFLGRSISADKVASVLASKLLPKEE